MSQRVMERREETNIHRHWQNESTQIHLENVVEGKMKDIK